MDHLLVEVVVRQEQDCITAVHDSLCIHKVLLDILPSNNTLLAFGILASRDGDDVWVRLCPERL